MVILFLSLTSAASSHPPGNFSVFTVGGVLSMMPWRSPYISEGLQYQFIPIRGDVGAPLFASPDLDQLSDLRSENR